MATVKLKISELKDTLKFVINNNKELQKQGKVPIACEVIGESGLGKTSGILQIGEELGLPVVKLNLAMVEELGDVVGFPIRQFQLCKEEHKTEGNGAIQECLWIDENAVNTYEKEGYKFTGKKRMSYCPPEWIADKTEGGILLLDDCFRADVRFLQAIMDLVNTQKYISWELPKGWTIILSNNPADGEYIVNSTDPAQKSRFISFELEFGKDDWAAWAEKNGIDGRCINFLLLHPELVDGTGVGKDKVKNKAVNPRSATMFFNTISGIKDFQAELPLIQLVGEGSVGLEFSTLFTTFINNKLDRLPTPEYMLTGKWENVENEIRGVVTDTHSGQYRADIGAVLMTRIINYSLSYAEKETVKDNMIERLKDLVTEDLFLTDLKYNIVREIFNGNKQKFKKLTLDADVSRMILA